MPNLVIRVHPGLCAAFGRHDRPHQHQPPRAAHNPALPIGVPGLAGAGEPVHAVAFDQWLTRGHPDVVLERYADDAVVHCVSETRAHQVLAGIADRMGELGLTLHPAKTQIVYCKDRNRPLRYERTAFTFLGYTFRPRAARDRQGRTFLAFLPAIQPPAADFPADLLQGLLATRMRCHPETRAYETRRGAEGKTHRDIRRSVKRALARRLYRRIEAAIRANEAPIAA